MWKVEAFCDPLALSAPATRFVGAKIRQNAGVFTFLTHFRRLQRVLTARPDTGVTARLSPILVPNLPV